MSMIKELVLDIESLLERGHSFGQVAHQLEIPVHFVVEAAELIESAQLEDFNPYATVNS